MLPGKCHLCLADSKLRCGKCNLVFYCTKEHQTSDWINHKDECNSLIESKEKQTVNVADKSDDWEVSPSQLSKLYTWYEYLDDTKYVWLVDCYRLRIDDIQERTGKSEGLYNFPATKFGVMKHFWIFCKLAAIKDQIPFTEWDWSKFLACSDQLSYPFEKTIVDKRYSSVDTWKEALNTLRNTAEVIYSCKVGEDLHDESTINVRKFAESITSEELFFNTPSIFDFVGNVSMWRELYQFLFLDEVDFE